MEIENLTVKYRRTINLDNYENAMLEASMTSSLDAADDPAETQIKLFRMARDSIRAQALPILAARRKARTQEIAAQLGRLPKDLRDLGSKFLSDSAQDILDAEVAQAQDVDGVYYAPDDLLLERAKSYAQGVLGYPASKVFSINTIDEIIEEVNMNGAPAPFTDLVEKLLTEELDRRLAAAAKEVGSGGDQGAD